MSAPRPEYYVLDADGEPLPCDDVLVWGEWFTENTAARRLAEDRHEGPNAEDIRISTVFIGLDFDHLGLGPPILWETLVFGGVLDGEMRRYTSRAAAVAGHQAMCDQVTATLTTATGKKGQ
jgi:hypothetical protein